MASNKQKGSTIGSLLSLGTLAVGFILIRYVLLGIHGMLQWPLVLMLLCLAVIIVSFAVRATVIPLSTSVSYTVGFFAAYVLKTDGTDPGGGRIDNLWVIWTVIIIVTIITSAIIEYIRLRKISR